MLSDASDRASGAQVTVSGSVAGFAATFANAERVIRAYAEDAVRHGPRRMTYTDMALALGLHPAQARNIGPLLDLTRDVCAGRGFPDISAVVVLAGTDLPSPRSFMADGRWRQTGLDRDGVRAVQARVLAFDWTRAL